MKTQEAIELLNRRIEGIRRVAYLDAETPEQYVSRAEAFDEIEALSLAIVALEAQEPKVLTYDEVCNKIKEGAREPFYYEPKNGQSEWVIVDWAIQLTKFIPGAYNKRMRIWTRKPTAEHMANTPWL